MLVLAFRQEDGVTISGPCRILVVETRGHMVRLGFEADRSVDVVRDNAKVKTPKHREKGAESV